jgi:integrase
MTLYQLIESALSCQQERADGTMSPLLAKSRRAPMRSSVKRYAAMLGIDPTRAVAEDYHRPDHEIRALVESKAPEALASNTVRNLINDIVWLLRTAVEQGWLEPLPPSLLSWRERRPYPGSFVIRGERPHKMTRYRLDLAECPPALRDDLTAYIRWCEAPIARDRDRHVAKRPVTSKKTYNVILRLAGFAVNTLHHPAASLTLSALCQPDVIEAFINWWFTERCGKMTAGLEQYLLIPKTIARHWLKDPKLADTLNKMLRSLPPTEAVVDKSKRWLTLAQLEEVGLSLYPLNARRLHDYAHLKQAYYGRVHSKAYTALYVEFSLIIRLLIRLPMRQRCIREMHLGKNLYQDHSGVWQIRFVGTELKVASRRGQTNRYEFPFPRELVGLLQEWLTDWRPKLASPEETHVFMSSNGLPFTESSKVSDMISRTTYRFTGVGVTPHIIRDIWVTEYLDANPGDVGGAARRLGNTEQMVLRYYAHILQHNVDARAETFLQGTFAAGKTP